MPDDARDPPFGRVTLTDCDREPIHIPGSIQPHGALIAFDPESHEVIQWAGDLEGLLGIGPRDVAGMSLRDLLGPGSSERLEEAIRQSGPRPLPLKNYEVEIETRAGAVDAIVHPEGPVLIIEFERAMRSHGGMHSTLFTVQNMLAEVNATTKLADYHQTCAEQIRELTGFARVMVYRFLEDGSGTVVAEAKADRLDSYLGLHYPETDIPKQARELYRTNWLRSIPDVAYTPQPLCPEINPLTGAPLDLSHSAFRSVSPLHIRYLENMGVAASMSLSIVNRNELWGLIACHHDAPHYLACETRAACEVFAQVYSLQLESREHAETFEYSLQQRSVHQQLITRLAREESLSDGLIRHRPNLLDLIQADGVAVFVDGEYAEIGHTPGQAGVQGILRRLDGREDGVFATMSLAESFPDIAGSLGETAGMLALSISRSPNDYIVWFRREVVETVTWAGNPAKAVEVVDGTETLTPRASFAAWRETVRGRSRPWKANEIEAVEALRLSVLEVVLRRMDQVARERAEAQEKQALMVHPPQNGLQDRQPQRFDRLDLVRLPGTGAPAHGLAPCGEGGARGQRLGTIDHLDSLGRIAGPGHGLDDFSAEPDDVVVGRTRDRERQHPGGFPEAACYVGKALREAHGREHPVLAPVEPAQDALHAGRAGRMADLRIFTVDENRDAVGLDQVEQVRPVADQPVRQALLARQTGDELLVHRTLLQRILEGFGMFPGFQLKRVDLREHLAGGARFTGQVVWRVMVAGDQPPEFVPVHDRQRHGGRDAHVLEIPDVKR